MENRKANILDKDWLEFAYKYFLQHAQQRVQHLNFFIVISSILTSISISTFQEKFDMHYLGIGLGLIQFIIAFVFTKIDRRNRHLIKIAESVIKNIEKNYIEDNGEQFLVFTMEEKDSIEQKSIHRNRLCFNKPLSHRKSYDLIYSMFGLIGLLDFLMACGHLIRI